MLRLGLIFLYKEGKEPGVGFAASTVNNHKAHLSLFMGWLHEQCPHLLPEDPTKGKGMKDIQLPVPEVKALTESQLRSLINLLDRLEILRCGRMRVPNVIVPSFTYYWPLASGVRCW
jgi:integrase